MTSATVWDDIEKFAQYMYFIFLCFYLNQIRLELTQKNACANKSITFNTLKPKPWESVTRRQTYLSTIPRMHYIKREKKCRTISKAFIRTPPKHVTEDTLFGFRYVVNKLSESAFDSDFAFSYDARDAFPSFLGHLWGASKGRSRSPVNNIFSGDFVRKWKTRK